MEASKPEGARSASEAIESKPTTGESLFSERRGLLFESDSEDDEAEDSSWLMKPTCWRSFASQSSKRVVERSGESPKIESKAPKSAKPWRGMLVAVVVDVLKLPVDFFCLRKAEFRISV